MSQNIIPVLTIDGPSGVGKGTIARIMAQKKKLAFVRFWCNLSCFCFNN